jgi:hypothetical protein
MYRDNTLIPSEAIRLAALGVLMEQDMTYAALARETRYFVERIIGPSLDLLGSSLELLRFEGLIGDADGEAETDDPLLCISQAGRDAFATLMTSNVRAPVNDVSRLVLALKMRFLHLLDDEDRVHQREMLEEMCETELARLGELHKRYGKGRLSAWLDLEIHQMEERLAWFRGLGREG